MDLAGAGTESVFLALGGHGEGCGANRPGIPASSGVLSLGAPAKRVKTGGSGPRGG